MMSYEADLGRLVRDTPLKTKQVCSSKCIRYGPSLDPLRPL